MWRNYAIVGVRALVKNKTYAFINVFGLAIGLAACLMLARPQPPRASGRRLLSVIMTSRIGRPPAGKAFRDQREVSARRRISTSTRIDTIRTTAVAIN